MLDKRTSALLFKINALCRTGSYQIVEESDLLSCFPEKTAMDTDGLRRILSYLKERGYIDIRYAEDGIYCLCPLPDGRLYFENALRERSDSARRNRSVFAVTALGAFLGSLFGALAAVLCAGAFAG